MRMNGDVRFSAKERGRGVTNLRRRSTSRDFLMRVFTVAALFPLLAIGAGTPENVIVVVNGDSWASTTIANEYAAMRGISPDHFVVLRDLPSFERVTVDVFRERILLPTLKAA